MSLSEQDEVLLAYESRTFVLEYDRLRSLFGRWFWHQRARKKVTLRSLTLYELQHIQRVYRELEKSSPDGLTTTLALAAIIGPVVHYLTPEQVMTLWQAHCELNRIPFVTAAEVEKGSPTPPSSDDLSAGPSNSPTVQSST